MADADERPNLLLVTTDQQRADTIGPSAPPFLRTPHLDALAAEGVRFDAAYAETPVCVPSRVTLMTGKSPLHHGITRNGPTFEVLQREATLPMRLRDLGYATAAIGKMHFTPQRARHGFEEMILPADYYEQMRRSGNPLQPMRHGLGQNELYPGMATVPEALTLTSWLVEQAVAYIRHRRDPTRPFFLWLSFTKPHPPLDPPEPYQSMYRDAPIPDPIVGDWAGDDQAPAVFARQRHRGSFDLLSPDTVRAARAAYYGLVTQIDYNLGRVLAALQDVGLLHRTMIVFTSDHGEFLGDHHTGNKVMYHQPSARVPLIVRPSERTPSVAAGTSVDVAVRLGDVLPTLVAAAGGTAEQLDGTDVLVVAAHPDEYHGRVVVGTASGADSDGLPYYLAVTDGRWKYIWYPEGAVEQLFDLTSDPSERHDRSGGDRRAATSCRNRLIHELDAMGRRDLLPDGDLLHVPPRDDVIAQRRARGWPGYLTDEVEIDVRH